MVARAQLAHGMIARAQLAHGMIARVQLAVMDTVWLLGYSWSMV